MTRRPKKSRTACSSTRSAVREAGRSRLDGGSHRGRPRTSEVSDPRQARFCESVESAHTAQGLSAKVAVHLGITREPLRLDSQAKYAVVARGEAEIYMRLPAKYGYKEKIWDHAGGVLLVEEAGGSVCDVMGQPLEFNHGYELLANRGIVAANRPLHPQVGELGPARNLRQRCPRPRLRRSLLNS